MEPRGCRSRMQPAPSLSRRRAVRHTQCMARVGAQRTDVAPVWPARLVPSASRLIYLDLNHWIGLAKAATGHPDGIRGRAALAAMRTHRGGWTYVIGSPLIMEITGILRRSQRADLGRVIEEFTDFACVMPLTTIAPLELETALTTLMGTSERFAPVPLVGRGVMQAFGLVGGLRVRDADGNDVTERARLESPVGPEEFDRRFAKADLDLNRGVIWGPADDEQERELREYGWDPSSARGIAERRAQQEREQAERLAGDPRWRRGRLRDLVAARYLALEIKEHFDDAIAAHGVNLEDVFDDVERARRFTDSMRAADIWITLMTAKHRNADSRWEPNDIFDVDALSVAAAYCDVVVTERHAAHVLTQAGVTGRLGTTILTDLDLLAAHLAAVN